MQRSLLRFGFLLTLLPSLAQALSLGDLRGVAVIGQPLDIRVTARVQPGESLEASCVSAEVYDADLIQPTPEVRLEPSAGGGWLVHVRSRSPVTEPVVTVLIQTRCPVPSTRRFVLLADVAQSVTPRSPESTSPLATPASPSEPAPLVTAPSTGPAAPGIAAASAPLPQPAMAFGQPRAHAVERKSSLSAAERAPRKSAHTPATARKDKSVTPVLRLDPLDILSDRIDLIETSKLFEPSVDALAQKEELTKLRTELQSLRQLAARHEARLGALQNDLKLAQEQRQPAWLVPALGGLLALALAGLLAMAWPQWRARRHRPHWWQAGGPSESSADSVNPTQWMGRSTSAPTSILGAGTLDQTSEAKPSSVVAAPPAGKAPPTPEPTPHVDIDLDQLLPEPTPPTQGSTKSTATGAPVQASVLASIGAHSPQDVRQQAEFLLSLGESEQALKAYQTYCDAHPDDSAAVALDLLDLAHQVGDRNAFAQTRDNLQRRYAVRLPAYASFQREGDGLEQHPDVLAELMTRWPQSSAASFIDRCLLRQPDMRDQREWDLAAFADLLLLHDVLADQNVVADPLDVVPAAPRALATRSPSAQAAASANVEDRAERAPDPPHTSQAARPTPTPAGSLVPPMLDPTPFATASPATAGAEVDPAPVESIPSLWADLQALAVGPDQHPQAAQASATSASSAPLDANLDLCLSNSPHSLDVDLTVPPAVADLPVLDAAPSEPQSDEPLPVAPTRYATRSRWQLNKKSSDA